LFFSHFYFPRTTLSKRDQILIPDPQNKNQANTAIPN
jgi:hypothetical protein